MALLIPILLLFLTCLSFLLYKINTQKHELLELQQEQQELWQKLTETMEDNNSLREELFLSTHPQGGVAQHGSLHVDGTTLRDSLGNAITLRGFSSHGLTWYPEYTNYSTLKELKEYGINTFRIAVYVEQSKSYSEEPTLNQKLLYSAIENSLAADLYTIVDWHVLKDENPNRHLEEAIAFFSDISSRYADNPGIIYEICNEPNGKTSWDDIVCYAQQVIPVIRANSPNCIILVGTPKYSTQIESVYDNQLEFENVMYTYHFYSGNTDLVHARDRIASALKNGIPIFVSEWGFSSIDEAAQRDTRIFLDYLESENIGWINWALSNKDESHAFLVPESIKLNGWDINSLSASGKFVIDYLSELLSEAA